MFKNPIIVFEGIEGSGKSLHIKNVSNYLKKKKIPFIKIREPGGNKNSEKIRKLILSNKSIFNKNVCPAKFQHAQQHPRHRSQYRAHGILRVQQHCQYRACSNYQAVETNRRFKQYRR